MFYIAAVVYPGHWEWLGKPGYTSRDIKHLEIIFISRLSCFPVSPVILSDRDTRQPGYKNNSKCFISRLSCIPATRSGDALYRGCRMVPHEVKFRLPRSTRDYTIPLFNTKTSLIFIFFRNKLTYIDIAAVSCVADAYGLGEVKLGSGMTGKLCHAWVRAWVHGDDGVVGAYKFTVTSVWNTGETGYINRGTLDYFTGYECI